MLAIVININPNIILNDLESLKQRLNDTLVGLLDCYGITDTLTIDVSINKSIADNISFIHINNHKSLIVPYYLANSLWHYTRNKHIEKKTSEASVLAELMQHTEAKELDSFLHDYIIESIKCNLNLLISDEFIENLFTEAFAQSDNFFLKSALADLIYKVIKYHISIRHFRTKIVELKTKHALQLAEEIIQDHRGKEVKIVCSSDYLFDLMKKFNDADTEVFKTIDEGMFYEFGLDFPDVKFIPNELPYANFKICINDFESCLLKGLEPDEIVIQKAHAKTLPEDDVRENILHPANDSECIIAPDSSVLSQDSQVWPPFAFIALHLINFYRKNSNWFFDLNMCKDIIYDLKQSSPALIECVYSKVDDYFICCVLRLLLEEKISLRNVELIFQSIMDFDYIVADGINNIVFDARLTTLKEPDKEWLQNPANTADFVRLNLKQYISSMLTNNSYSLYVYLLEQQMEEKIIKMDDDIYDDPVFYDLLNSIETVITNRKKIYPVLCTVEVRRKFRRIIKKRFPEMAVINYQELSPFTNIIPVAKISFNSITIESNTSFAVN